LFLDVSNLIDHVATELRRHAREARIAVVTGKTKRHDRNTRDARKLSRQIEDRFLQHFVVIDIRTQHHLRVHFNARIEQSCNLSGDVGALFIDAEQVRAHVEIRRMDRNVLRRQSLFDDAAHLVFGYGRERGVVAVQERETNVFVLDEQRRPGINRIAVTETENTRVGTLPGDDLFERQAKIFSLGAFELDFPVFPALFAHLEHEFGFTGGMKTKVEIVADDTPVDFYDPVARFEFDLSAQAVRRHVGDLDPAAANVCNCRRDCKFVHTDILCHRSWEKVAISRLILLLMKRPVSIALFASLLLVSYATAAAQEMAGVVPVKASANDSSGASAPAQALTEIYRVGVGDVLDIRLLNSANSRSTLFTVMDGGVIDLPIAGGTISVAGFTPNEIQNMLAVELKRRAVGEKISVGVRQYLSHSVTVTGLVVHPGTKFLRREMVPLYVVLAESQLRNDAGRVAIMRAGTSNESHDLGDPATLNLNVQSGDVITISGRPQEFYYIGGRINYPGQKPFQPGITLLQAILAAGGPTRQESKVEISREGSEGKLVTIRYNIKQIKAGEMEDPRLQAGDRIEVAR
jgi:protein involved in polysaccharide export with SLBB domain